jgi:hypothetical protein
MTERPAVVAQRLLNLYRQAHVIIGGWAAVNGVLIGEADGQVLEELKKLPNGEKLSAHIRNLRDGRTRPDSIDRDLMPYGGAMQAPAAPVAKLSDEELKELEGALNSFVPEEGRLHDISGLAAVRKFGDEWLAGVEMALGPRADLAAKWKLVQQTARAYDMWTVATGIMSKPISERERARVQADLPEFETYLPMFGDAGGELLAKLRAFVSL